MGFAEGNEGAAEVSPGEMIQRVLGDIEVDYRRKRGKTKARLDSLRLSTARMLLAEANPSPGFPGFVLSEFGKAAIKATKEALLNNWEPMVDFISMETTATYLGYTFTDSEAPAPVLSGLKRLQQSLGEVKNK